MLPASVLELSLKLMRVALFPARTMKHVMMKPAHVLKIILFVVCLRRFCHIVYHFSLIVRSVGKDKQAQSLSFAVLEVPHVDRPVFLVNFAATLREIILNVTIVTSSSSPK